MTPIQKLIKKVESMRIPDDGHAKIIHSIIMEELEHSLKEEEMTIKNAIHFALDEDGHTGEWRVRFAQKYYQHLKNKDK